MLDAHPELTIPPETNFLPELIDMTRGKEATPDEVHRLPARASPLGRLPPRPGRAARAAGRGRHAAHPEGGDPLLLRPLRLQAGQAALGRQVPALRGEHGQDPPPPAGVAVHPPDPRRPRRRPLEAAKEGRRPRGGAQRGQALEQPDRPLAQALAEGRPLHRGPLRGPGHRHRAGAAPGLRFLRARVGRRRSCATTSSPRTGSPRWPPRSRKRTARSAKPPRRCSPSGGPSATSS